MKNNKGFAISSVVYAMLILFLGLILLILGNLASRKAMFDKEKNEILTRFNGNEDGYRTYSNGEVVYFNVTTGEECSDYTESQSNTGVKRGCMKFYAFNDDGGSNLNLLLDHNTTATVLWNSNESNTSGPNKVIERLKTDTASWVGTITPENYSIDQSDQTSKAKYTVDYSSYKARLITAQEIAKITGNTTFDEITATSEFYFDTNTDTESTTCKNGNTSGCNYGWLYDRTSKSCTDYGCLNNSDVTTYGYWTVSSSASNSSIAWLVLYAGSLDNNRFVYEYSGGVRPVITISKSKLSNDSSVLCTAKTTATTGNVPSGNYAYGDEYTCELGDNEEKTFFVLETNGDKVSLIMDRNFTDDTISKSLAWCIDDTDNSLTCKNITSKEEGTPLKYIQDKFGTSVDVSVPSGKQIATAGKDSAWTNTNYTGTNLSIWLYGNLSTNSAPYGYWTSTSIPNETLRGWVVYNSGNLDNYGVGDSGSIGLRPVITISKSQIK